MLRVTCILLLSSRSFRLDFSHGSRQVFMNTKVEAMSHGNEFEFQSGFIAKLIETTKGSSHFCAWLLASIQRVKINLIDLTTSCTVLSYIIKTAVLLMYT